MKLNRIVNPTTNIFAAQEASPAPAPELVAEKAETPVAAEKEEPLVDARWR